MFPIPLLIFFLVSVLSASSSAMLNDWFSYEFAEEWTLEYKEHVFDFCEWVSGIHTLKFKMCRSCRRKQAILVNHELDITNF